MVKSLAEIRAQVAANNMAWLETALEAETDEARHAVLASLLAIERTRAAVAEQASSQLF